MGTQMGAITRIGMVVQNVYWREKGFLA